MARGVLFGFMMLAVLSTCAACDSGSNNPYPQASSTADAQPSANGAAVTSPSAAPAADATADPAIVAIGKRLRPLALQPADVPEGYTAKSDQPFSKKEATTADISVPPLAIYFDGSDMTGALARLFTRDQPSSALTSIVYLFTTPASAKGLVDTVAGLTIADYFGATAVDRVQSEKIGDAAQMMRYETSTGRTLEYTWTQGRLAGQIVLRGGVDSPDDVAQLVTLAHKQSDHMTANAP